MRRALSAWKKKGVPQRSQSSPSAFTARWPRGTNATPAGFRPCSAAVISALDPTGFPSRGKLVRNASSIPSTTRRSASMVPPGVFSSSARRDSSEGSVAGLFAEAAAGWRNAGSSSRARVEGGEASTGNGTVRGRAHHQRATIARASAAPSSARRRVIRGTRGWPGRNARCWAARSEGRWHSHRTKSRGWRRTGRRSWSGSSGRGPCRRAR